MKPLVAIVGKANVGKSRLFNRLVGHARAIVHDRPGITRDRHYAPAEWTGREFVAVDTGGMEMAPAADLERRVTEQSLAAVAEADVVVCLFDGQHPPGAEDEDIVRALRKLKKRVVWTVNKIDDPSAEGKVSEFARLGVDPLVMISAEHGLRIDELLEAIVVHFPDERAVEQAERTGLRISVVGRPNVGKSTLVNRLAGSDRVVAHELPGTTRDTIDVEIAFEGKDYIFVDTAGVKRSWKTSERLERWTSIRSLKSVERSQIACQLIDATEGLSKQDVALANFVLDEGKGLVLLVNKWDLMHEDWRAYGTAVRQRLGRWGGVPVISISAATGYHCLKVFSEINRLNRHLSTRLATSAINRVIERSLAEHHLPAHRGQEVRIFYATQTGIYPPTFTLFSNHPAAVPFAYRRYLMHRLQAAIGSDEVPVKIICRKKT